MDAFAFRSETSCSILLISVFLLLSSFPTTPFLFLFLLLLCLLLINVLPITMPCQFQLYSEVVWLYAYIYLFLFTFFSLLLLPVYVTHCSSHMYVCAQLLQPCPTLCNPMNHSLPGSSVHGIITFSLIRMVK